METMSRNYYLVLHIISFVTPSSYFNYFSTATDSDSMKFGILALKVCHVAPSGLHFIL